MFLDSIITIGSEFAFSCLPCALHCQRTLDKSPTMALRLQQIKVLANVSLGKFQNALEAYKTLRQNCPPYAWHVMHHIQATPNLPLLQGVTHNIDAILDGLSKHQYGSVAIALSQCYTLQISSEQVSKMAPLCTFIGTFAPELAPNVLSASPLGSRQALWAQIKPHLLEDDHEQIAQTITHHYWRQANAMLILDQPKCSVHYLWVKTARLLLGQYPISKQ